MRDFETKSTHSEGSSYIWTSIFDTLDDQKSITTKGGVNRINDGKNSVTIFSENMSFYKGKYENV